MDVLANDILPSNGSFTHTIEITASGNSQVYVQTLNGPPGESLYWFQTISGSGTITSDESGATSTIELSGFQFHQDLGAPCTGMAWGDWTGGTITITNDWGTRTYTGAIFTAGMVIDHKLDYGRATGMFTDGGGKLQIALPSFTGTQAVQTVSGDGLLYFTTPHLTITSPPTHGTAQVQDGEILYTPDPDTEGVDSFQYQVMTDLADFDIAEVSIGTMDLDISDPDGTELSETAEDNPGLALAINDDDDDANSQEDLLDSGFVDNDLAKLKIKERAPAALDPLDGYFVLSFDTTKVRLWHKQDKTVPGNHPDAEVGNGTTRFNLPDSDEDYEVWVEGIGSGETLIQLTWHNNTDSSAAVFDSVLVDVYSVPHPILDIDTDSDNTGPVDRTLAEDDVEDGAGPGKKLFVKASAASEVVLDANVAAVDDLASGYQLVLIVSPGLNLWADSAKTTRLTSADSSTIPEDDSLGETYIWTGSWVGTETVYVEGTREGSPKIHWRLTDSAGSIIARDTVKFLVEKHNSIFVGIDGTGTHAWLEGPDGHTPDNPARWNSHTRNLYDEMAEKVKYPYYDYGPDNYQTGADSDDKHDRALNYAVQKYAESGGTASVALVGWSRGAAIALWVANDLSDLGINVDFVGLYDPVDMSLWIPDGEAIVAPMIDRVDVVGPTLDAPNLDYLIFERMSWDLLSDGLRTSIPYIRPESGNTNTLIARFLLDASHGSIGGTPGYNDEGLDSWGEDWNTDYNYSVDRSNSIIADQIVREGLRAEGWDVREIPEDEYGFPLENPTAQ